MNVDADGGEKDDGRPVLDAASMDIDEIMRWFGVDRGQAWEMFEASRGRNPSDMEIVEDPGEG